MRPTIVCVALLVGCGQGGGGGTVSVDPPSAAAPSYAVSLVVVDESSAPVADATVRSSAGVSLAAAAGAPGRVELGGLRQPVLVVVEAPGFLAEPLAIGREMAGEDIVVRLLSARGAGGERRLVVHFAGDAMLGRRYLEPTLEDTAVVVRGDGGASARAVVSSVAPLFGAAHVRSVNLETVVGDAPLSAAYPAKRFLLESPLEVTHLLDELSVDFVTLGNNHLRDWLDAGVDSTLAALDGAGLRHVGGGRTAIEARAPLVFDTSGYRVACLSYTTVNGDFVNDSLPDATAPIPAELPEREAWQYEERVFGFLGPSVSVPFEARRVGAAWRVFEDAERAAATDGERAALWAALEAVYPEAQDWVARRGHGGANPWSSDGVVADIASARAEGAELVIVQLHAGFQFLEVESELVQAAAHAAIDAGADLVICHHPHVLQGLEWYRGKLVAHSLGNFVFDQDFLATFDSMVLRVVLEDTEVIEARLLPVVLRLYRPVPVVGRAARDIVRMVAARSWLPARSERVDGVVRSVLRDEPEGSERPRLVFERNSARIERGSPDLSTLEVVLSPDEIVVLDDVALTRSRAADGSLLGSVLLGSDLLRWGHFDDVAADGEDAGGVHWLTNDTYKRIEVLGGAEEGERGLRLRRLASNSSRTLARPLARVPFRLHRVWRDLGSGIEPADGLPSYTLLCRARLEGDGAPLVRFDVYHFDDTNPTADPESSLLRSRSLALPVPADGEWHDVVLEIPAAILAGAGELEANSTMPYVGLEPPSSGTSVLLVDDLRILEWRAADALPDVWGAVDAVRAVGVDAPIYRVLHRLGGTATR